MFQPDTAYWQASLHPYAPESLGASLSTQRTANSLGLPSASFGDALSIPLQQMNPRNPIHSGSQVSYPTRTASHLQHPQQHHQHPHQQSYCASSTSDPFATMGRSTLGTTTHSFRTGSASTSSIHPSSLSTNDFSIMNPSNAVTPQMNDHLRGGYPTTTQTGNLFEQSMRLQQQARSSTTTLQTAQNPSSFSSLNNNDRLGIVSAGASVMTNHNHTAAIVPEGPFGTPTAAGAANAGFGQSNSLTALGGGNEVSAAAVAAYTLASRSHSSSMLPHSFVDNEFGPPSTRHGGMEDVQLLMTGAATTSTTTTASSGTGIASGSSITRPGSSSSSSDSTPHSHSHSHSSQLRISNSNGLSFIYDPTTNASSSSSTPPTPTPEQQQLPQHASCSSTTTFSISSSPPSSTNLTSSTASPAKPHACKTCGATFQRGHDLSRHIKSHDHPRYYCQGCNKVYSRQDSVRRHVARAKCAGGDVRVGTVGGMGVGGGGGEGGGKLGSMSCDELKVGTMSNGLNEGYD